MDSIFGILNFIYLVFIEFSNVFVDTEENLKIDRLVYESKNLYKRIRNEG